MGRRAFSIKRTHLIAGIATGLFLAVLVLTGRLLWDTRDAAQAQARQALGNLALSLERDIARNIEIYQLSLRATATGLRLVDDTKMDADTTQALLFDGAVTAQHFGRMLVTNAAGDVVRLSMQSGPLPAINLADRPYFQFHMDHADQSVFLTFLDRPRLADVPALVLSMRVNRPDGSFGGVAVGSIRLAYFNEMFGRFELGRSGKIALIGVDGRRIASTLGAAEEPGADIRESPLFQRIQREGPGTFEATSRSDGQRRLYVVRKLDGFPLYLVVARSADEVLAGWRGRAWAVGGGLFLCLLFAVGLAWMLRRELRRRRFAEQGARRAELSAQYQARVARASEAKLRVYFKHLADGLLAIRVLSDGDFALERANAAARTMLGMESGHQGHDLAAFLPPSDAHLLHEMLRRCVAEGQPVQYGTARDGRELRFTLAPVRDEASAQHPEGRVTLVLASLRDVTHQSELEAQLRQAQRMEAVGQLTAGVAHDFNNLLQAQLGSLELLLDEVEDRPQAQAYTQMAMAAGERAAQLTHSLLSFSRKQVLRPEPVALPNLLSGLQTLLSRTLDPHIALRVDVEADLPCILADPAQLESALLNLCLNARDAMRDGGGQLLIEAYDGAVALDAPDALARDGFLVLAVSDQGRGMPPDILARACEPFFTTKGVGQGSGLGLSMVQGFAQQSGGELRMQSWSGAGTRMELWLPRAASSVSPVPARARPRGAGRVLLVDDVPDVLSVIGETLEAAGFQVTCAADGAAALMRLRSGRFDAMVTDFAMPGMNGAELIAAALALRPALPMLVITGYADGAKLGGLPAHVQVVHKPFRSDVLIHRLRDMIGMQHPRPALATAEAVPG